MTFNYTQSDSATGSGSIGAFTFNDGGGDINFTATSMPSATVRNPVPASTPAGFVGAMNAFSGNSNEADTAVGLLWSGVVTATGTRGGDTFQMDIPLVYVPKVTQAPDVSDYTWNISFGDSAGNDVTGTALRFATYLSRDNVIDAVETPNTFQRYTQLNHTFVAGMDTFTNSNTSTATIKDAVDGGAPAGTDAAGRDLSIYYGWRDGGSILAGTAILVDNFTFGGLLNTNDASLRMVPEPSAGVLAAFAGAGLLLRRRRR